jgi:enamine deaminase RidA (YjgF/YER057c/UK114 family)
MTDESGAQIGRVEFLNPAGLVQSRAFSHVCVVSGLVRTIYIGGQDAIDANGQIVGKGDLGAQTEQILTNIETALKAAGADLEHIVKWTVFTVVADDFGPAYQAFQRVWGGRPNPPLITAAVVKALGNPDWLVEMDAIAVVPDKQSVGR